MMTRAIDFRDELTIVIPAPDGLFIGLVSKTENAVEIRTFIDSRFAMTDRKVVRDLMIQVSEPLLDSPLSASPAVEFANLDFGNAFLTPALCRKLAPHSDVLARCLLWKPDQDASPRNAQLFREQLSLLAALANPYWDMFENAPLREFLTQANHALRQSNTPKSASGSA
jgi:hypothetical protein